jgi:anti-sigma factor RsiW
MKRTKPMSVHLTDDPAGLFMRYLDGEVSEGERARIDAHLSGCRDCTAEVRAYRALFGRLGSLPPRRPPAYLGSRILAAIEVQRARARNRFRWLEVAGTAYAASAVAFVVALGLSPWREDVLSGVRGVLSALLSGSVSAFVGSFDRIVSLLTAAVSVREAAQPMLSPLAPLWRSFEVLAAQPELRLGISLALVLTTALWWLFQHRPAQGPGRMKDAHAFI